MTSAGSPAARPALSVPPADPARPRPARPRAASSTRISRVFARIRRAFSPRPGAPRYDRGEEVAHAVTHGVGLLLAVAALATLVVMAARRGDPWRVVGFSVYGATLVILYLVSTLYHAIPGPRTKAVLRVIDHSAIYLLIAGTYTPFLLVTLRGPWGWSLFGVVWGLAIFGVLGKCVFIGRFPILSVTVYVLMGWLVVIAIRPLTLALPATGTALLAAGGVAYTAGLLFYACRGMPYHHAVWHLFVLAGSVLHFLCLVLYVARPA